MAEFRMPSLGADMTEGVLLEWLIKPGDAVRKGDPVAVVDTAKAAIEVECFHTGVVEQLIARPGDRIPVGGALATIATSTVDAAAPPDGHRPPAPTLPAAAETEPVRVEPLASPVVRRFAATHHVDLTRIPGTGVGGRITHADVQRAAATAQPPASPTTPARRRVSPMARRLAVELGVDLATVLPGAPDAPIDADDVRRAAATTHAEPAPATEKPAAERPAASESGQAAMRTAIANLMARSKREIPHYYLTTTIDLGTASEWLTLRNRELPVRERLVPAALLLKAAALAARAVPELNGFWIDGGFVSAPAVHLGVAVSLRGGGLVTPAIRDAADLTLTETMVRLRDAVSRARHGRLRASELSDPTITVSNLGDQGVESILGVIYPPQVALVGFGTIVERPCVVDGLIWIRPMVVASLSGDHRATDGHIGARYLSTVDHLLQKPEEL